MSSRDHATAAFIAQLSTVGDGAVAGILLALCAAGSWIKYATTSTALRRIKDAPIAHISDLRWLINPSDGDGDRDGDGRLVVVRGRVQPKPSFDASWIGGKSHGGALISQGSGDRAVVVKQIQTCLYNEWRGILGWRFDLHAFLAKSWKEQKSISFRSSVINDAASGWGVECIRYEIMDVTPPPGVLTAMKMQVEAQRKQRAQILEVEEEKESHIKRAEGNKQSTILTTEGEKESQILATQGGKESTILSAQGDKESTILAAQGINICTNKLVTYASLLS